MQEFKIQIKEFSTEVVAVEAECLEDALEEARNQYNNGEIVLDSSDFIGVEISQAGKLSESYYMESYLKSINIDDKTIEKIKNGELKQGPKKIILGEYNDEAELKPYIIHATASHGFETVVYFNESTTDSKFIEEWAIGNRESFSENPDKYSWEFYDIEPTSVNRLQQAGSVLGAPNQEESPAYEVERMVGESAVSTKKVNHEDFV